MFTAARRADIAIACICFVVASVWGTVFWNGAVGAGRRPYFYQSYFEPAVMLACGKGFVLSDPQPAAVRAFILEESDRFSCSELPPGLRTTTRGLYQRPWRYLMTTVALAWKVLGISWSGLGPLFGILFGMSTTLAYLTLRFVVARTAAVLGAAVLTVSTLQLTNLPNLRDYAKAPLTLALVLILLGLVTRPWRRRTVLLLSLAYGLVMGFGYGFRTDLLIDIPPFLITMALFMPGGVLRNIGVKAAAIGLFLAGFVAAGWPIITSVVGSGGCQWHVFLLGLTTPFNDSLGVRPAVYDWGTFYQDDFIWTTVSSYASRFHPNLGYIEYCSHEYDLASWSYLQRIVATFPADILTRTYAAVLKVLDLPFTEAAPPFTNHAVVLFRLREFVLALFRGAGPFLAALFVLAISWTSLRLALFAVFFFLYFGGYPAIQFGMRHYFHLEFIGWAVIAFLAERGVRAVLARGTAAWRDAMLTAAGPGDVRRVLLCAVVVPCALLLPLGILRSYQSDRVRQLLESYVDAPASPSRLVPVEPGKLRLPAAGAPHDAAPADPGRPETTFVEAVLDARACGPGTTVTFQYDPVNPSTDFSRTVSIERAAGAGRIRLFEPVYTGFEGLDVSDRAPGCLEDVVLLNDLDRFPLMLSAQLPPGWDRGPLYQRISFFGGTRR